MIRPGAVLKALRPDAEWTLTDSTLPVMANLVMHSDVPDVTQAEYDEMAAQMEAAEPWIDIRAERDELLRDSDWTDLPHNPLSSGEQDAWVVYREALRDIPQVFSDAEAIEWPEAPED